MRPRALDLFCGAGGAAMGLYCAGFDVTGIDIKRQPRYPFRFIQGDALKPPVRLEDFDLIWASPPCQAYSRATAWTGDRSSHPDLIGAVQAMLHGSHYVIENVQEARRLLRNPSMICGSMVGLPVRRHRYFETSFEMPLLGHPCFHRRTDLSHDHGSKQTEAQYRDGMKCDWMTVHEAREAIPPAYAEHIGRYALMALEAPTP